MPTTPRRRATGYRHAFALLVLASCGERIAVEKEPLRITGQQGQATAGSSRVSVKKSPTSDTLEIGGEWAEAGDATIWTGYAIHGHVSRIEENWLPSGDPNSKRVLLYDTAGHLVRLAEERHQMVSNPSASPTMLNMIMTIEFRGAGVVRTNKVVDGIERTVQPWDIENAVRHAEQLVALARQGLPAR